MLLQQLLPQRLLLEPLSLKPMPLEEKLPPLSSAEELRPLLELLSRLTLRLRGLGQTRRRDVELLGVNG